MRINNNLMAMNTHRQLGINSDAGSKSIEKLSSGYRINRAGDDAAGLAISEKMRAQIRGLSQSSRNAQDSISLVQTAEGALNETQAILQRMRELAVQSANDTNVDADRTALQNEVDQLAVEITRIANNTEFNERKLLNGGLSADAGKLGELTFHIGANESQNMQLGIAAMDAKTLGVSRDVVSAATGVGSGDVTAATFDTKGGAGVGVLDTAVVTLSYTAGTPGSAAKAAVNTAANNAAAGTNLSGINADTSLTVQYDGTTYTLSNAALKAYTGAGTNADLANLLGTAVDGGGTALSTVVGVDGGAAKLVMTALTPGAGSIQIDFAGTDTATLATAFGYADGATGTAGADAVAAVSASVTMTSSLGHVQTVAVDGAATSFSVTSGSFKGVSVTTSGALSAIAGGDDNFTISATTDQASAATFTGGALVEGAKTSAGIDISSRTNANLAITTINNAITQVSDERAKLGAVQNRLEHTIKNLDTSAENLQASESRIRDVDMAKEMMNFTKQNILQQAAQAMLAQANQAPQGVLQLLR